MDFVPESAAAVRAFLEAEDIAARASQPLSSAHLLLALFTFPNRAQVLLSERNIDEDTVLDTIRVLEDEPARTVKHIRERARDIARGSASKEIDCLHVLIAITRLRDCFAYTILQRTGTSITSLRNVAVSYVTGNMPRRYRHLPKPSDSPRPLVQERSRSRPKVVQLTAEPEPELEDEFDDLAAVVEAAESLPAPESRPLEISPPPAYAPPRPQLAPAGEAIDLQEVAPTLAGCGVDLSEQARTGGLDMVVGRERELEALIDILGKRRANNPILVGSPGVGKTAIVEGLAVKIARGDEDVSHFQDKILFSLDTGALIAGTSLRGAFSERLGAIKQEVAAANGRIVVFIDELHTLIGAGSSGDGPQDAANELKTALARGEFPCIGATTIDEFKKYIEKDPALERRFSPIDVEEPSTDEAILIVEGAISPYADHHQVSFALDAVHAAVNLSNRFITERKLPDKAFAVLDLAGSRARRRGAGHVERIDVARVIHEWSGVPLDRLAEADADRFARAESIIGEKFIGHTHVVDATCRAIRRGFAGFNGKRPIGSFLFLGPTGVGKTELVKIMAEFLFGQREAVVRVDMSELSEAHSVSRLIGAQPGYVGFEEGGQLTEALRKKPFQIVLFDEVEKAHKDVLNILLQVLDEGHLTDSKGRRVSFANTLVVLTSNLGADAPTGSKSIGFGASTGNGNGNGASNGYTERVKERARGQMAPELWGRLDEHLVFHPLERDQVRRIASLQLLESSRTLFAEKEVTLEWNDDLLDFLLDNGGYSPESGARGMRHTIQRLVEAPVAESVLDGELSTGDHAKAKVRNDEVVITRVSPPQ